MQYEIEEEIPWEIIPMRRLKRKSGKFLQKYSEKWRNIKNNKKEYSLKLHVYNAKWRKYHPWIFFPQQVSLLHINKNEYFLWAHFFKFCAQSGKFLKLEAEISFLEYFWNIFRLVFKVERNGIYKEILFHPWLGHNILFYMLSCFLRLIIFSLFQEANAWKAQENSSM